VGRNYFSTGPGGPRGVVMTPREAWRAIDELFDARRGGRPGGLAWQLKGELVDALGEHRARLADARTILRLEIRGRE
jgi:hypothetical protein